MNTNNSRRRLSWTDKNLDKLNKIKGILEDLEKYKPLTLRQIYYQLVSSGDIENKVSEYTMLSGLLKWARIDEYISWDDIEDRIRVFHDLTGWLDSQEFIHTELYRFLIGYRRDLMQTQKKYIELWIEKDALSSLFTKIAIRYTIPVIVCRGFSSISFLHNFKNRLLQQDNKTPVMLYFGDLDPSGVEMLDSMKTTLRDELNISDIEFKRCALLKSDITKYKLPHNPAALKKTDTRAKKYTELYGELAVELDALRPDILEKRIIDSIDAELEIDNFDRESQKENYELKKLKKLKNTVREFIYENK